MIRKAVLSDALDIYNLESECFSNKYSLSTINQDLGNDKVTMFLKYKNNRLIGYISLYHFLDEANLQRIAVIQSERRQGVASELIEFATQYLKSLGIKSFYLEVNENNLIAIKVYEKLGFNNISTRKNYYGNENAIIFQKFLDLKKD